jgi:hypothetical protein
MRCKVGDLAVYVGDRLELHGRIVLVVAPFDWEREPAWHIDPPLPDDNIHAPDAGVDAALRPLRANDGEDEMLRIAGKPVDIEFPEWSQQ